jgi:hypoxanthine phosphoribosyltransferase
MGVKKVYYDWNDINNLLDIIWFKSGNKFKSVTGIPRGGTILAVLYSHRFNVKYAATANLDSEQLIIDDIADSGDTLKLWKKTFPTNTFATIHYKDISIVKPEIFAKEIKEDYGWIVYPWEKEDSNTIQDYLDN